MSFGIKGGLNLSDISNNTTDIVFAPNIKFGYHAGVFLNIRFGSKSYFRDQSFVGLQPELSYSHQGFVVNGNAINFNYITVPLMVKLNFGKTKFKGNFNFEFGPCFNYLIEVSPNSMEITNGYDFFSEVVTLNLSDLKSGKDLGVAAGIGYEFGFGLIVGARYNHGLFDMAKNLLWKNRVAAVSLGWKF